MAARRESQRLRRAARGRGEAEQEEDTAQEDKGGGESSGGLLSELKDTASEAALAVLAPVAKQAATKVAKLAVKKGPELFEDKLLPMLEDGGGPAGLLDSVKDLVPGGGGDGDAGDGTGKGRRMPIQQAVDVAAPIDVVYDQFTLFEDWPKFMHRVERVEQDDEAHVTFHEKMWGFRREWEAEIVEQYPDERIVWESVSGPEHTGVVTFHELSERLTRVELNVDFDPSGPIEKIARGARFAKRAARADLKRFKAYVEMHDGDPDGWRGEIEDGDVVDYEEPEAEAEEVEEEPEAEQEPDEEPEAEEKPKPKRRQSSRSRGSSNGSSKSKAASSKSSSRRSRAKSGGSSRSRSSSNGSSGSTRRKSSSSRSKSTRSKSSSGSRS